MGEDFGVRESLKKLPSADPVLSSRILTPEEYSELAAKAPMTKHGEMVTLADNSRFFRIERTNPEGLDCVPETQHAIAMILKGIANVADVVSVQSADAKEMYHFSTALDLGAIGEKENPYALGAQQILLDTLFGDYDHHVIIGGDKELELGSNVRTDTDNKRFYFFDFAVAFEEAFLSGRTYSRPYIESRMQWVNQNEQSRTEFQHLLGGVRERFNGSQGLTFVRGIVEKSGLPMRKLFAHHPTDYIEAMVHAGFNRYFRDEMIRRVTFMEEYLETTSVTPLPEEEPYTGPLQ